MNNPAEGGKYNTPLLCSGIWISRVLGPLGFILVISSVLEMAGIFYAAFAGLREMNKSD